MASENKQAGESGDVNRRGFLGALVAGASLLSDLFSGQIHFPRGDGPSTTSYSLELDEDQSPDDDADDAEYSSLSSSVMSSSSSRSRSGALRELPKPNAPLPLAKLRRRIDFSE